MDRFLPPHYLIGSRVNIPIGAILAGLGVIVVLIAGGALAGAYFKANWGESTINLLTKDNDARGERIKTLEHEKDLLTETLADQRESMDEKVTTLSAQLMQSQQRIKDLTELVTGATAVHALGTELAMQIETQMNDLGHLLEVNANDLRQGLREHSNLISQRLVGIESGFARLMLNPPTGMSVREGDRRQGDRRQELADPFAGVKLPDE